MNPSIRKSNYLALMISLMVVAYVFISAQVVIEDDILSSLFQFAIIFLVPIGLYRLFFKVPIQASLNLNPVSGKTMGLTTLFSLSLIPLAVLLSVLSNLFSAPSADSAAAIPPLWYALIAAAIIPPLFEEVIFRGLFLNGYKEAPVLFTAIVNGLIFSAIHLSPSQFAYAFMFGFAFVYLFRATNSLLTTIWAHAVVNGTNVFLDRHLFSKLSDDHALIILLVIVVCAIFFTIVARKIYQAIKALNAASMETTPSLVRPPFFSLDMLPYHLSILILVLTFLLR